MYAEHESVITFCQHVRIFRKSDLKGTKQIQNWVLPSDAKATCKENKHSGFSTFSKIAEVWGFFNISLGTIGMITGFI